MLQAAEYKQNLRRELRQLRDAIPPETRREYSAIIQERLIRLPQFGQAGLIHCYASFASEPDTFAIMRRALALGKRVFVPVLHNNYTRALLHMEVFPDTVFVPGLYGIPEPQPRAGAGKLLVNLPAGVASCVLVPLLGFDHSLHRLGYGKGFYDRFLAQIPAGTTIGLAYAECELGALPVEAHDVALDVIVTQKEILGY